MAKVNKTFVLDMQIIGWLEKKSTEDRSNMSQTLNKVLWDAFEEEINRASGR